ncbi:hypothetical protein ACRE_029680 [Hapsidospora chrysogenum ATCC 11550]|uniref:Uncharacterized protein n=1 Tax=Hapsidospora chrysogenum (strain ATCC 11550 / CBS 779.69 / DSM 880 / IAM 14645 / JCM 23072 / IMI 49137) TaxID=857340 RepID=A0A086TA16_HAPC1|nr:hypothetical protein ACRE_029680 [Hapsidospora chrysogenum ATCC 11550]
MSSTDGFQRDLQASTGLTLNLSSNNPFRNRATSPSSPFDDPPARPVSRNPFLDQPPPPLRSPGGMSNNSTKSLSAEEIFNALTLDDKRNLESKPALIPSDGAPSTAAVDGNKEAFKPRRMPPPGQRPGGPGGPSSSRRGPPPQRRPRRNSDSSILDFDSMPLTEEEKRIIAKRRERERLRREGGGEGDSRDARDKQPERREKREGREPRDQPREARDGRDGKQRSKPGRPNRRVDIIDQLDATSIYGTGLFHHDGPFDALNPHRNRTKSRRAPMQAFPKDSLNNSLGGAGPLNKEPDHATFMGQGNEEAFRDYSYGTSKAKENVVFDPIARGDVIHGDESVGLGTSTFLEGTPAARTAIQRTRQEQQQDIMEGGLQRKKSLAQRIRHVGKGPRDYSGRMATPDAYGSKDVASAGTAEANPFFSEYGKGDEGFTVRGREGAMSPMSPPPRRGSVSGGPLERRATADGSLGSEEPTKPSGFLGRMKSLKGGRRPSRAADTGPASPPPGNPGTAI